MELMAPPHEARRTPGRQDIGFLLSKRQRRPLKLRPRARVRTKSPETHRQRTKTQRGRRKCPPQWLLHRVRDPEVDGDLL